MFVSLIGQHSNEAHRPLKQMLDQVLATPFSSIFHTLLSSRSHSSYSFSLFPFFPLQLLVPFQSVSLLLLLIFVYVNIQIFVLVNAYV